MAKKSLKFWNLLYFCVDKGTKKSEINFFKIWIQILIWTLIGLPITHYSLVAAYHAPLQSSINVIILATAHLDPHQVHCTAITKQLKFYVRL